MVLPPPDSLRAQLLGLAARAARARGVSEARLATIILNNGKFFFLVRSGAGFTVRSFERVEAWVRQHFPAALTDDLTQHSSPAPAASVRGESKAAKVRRLREMRAGASAGGPAKSAKSQSATTPSLTET